MGRSLSRRILYIGEFPPPYGGVTVKNSLLVNDALDGLDVEVFNLYRFKREKAKTPVLAGKLIAAIRHADRICVGVGHPWRTCEVFRLARRFRGEAFLGKITVFMMGMGTPGYLREHPENVANLAKGCCIFAESKSLVRQLAELGCANGRYLPNFRNGERARSPRPVGDVVHFVYFAQVRPEKGFGTLAEAVSRLNAEGLQERFDVAVYGDVLEGYEDEAVRLIAPNMNMEYRGAFDAVQGDVYAELNQYDASSSSSWREGMSGTNIECKFAGIANIVSNAGFNPECVEDGVDGLLVKPRDVDSLVDAMRKVILDHGLLQRLKQGSYESRVRYDVATWRQEVRDTVCGESSEGDEPIRVLQSVGAMNHGGIEHFIMNVYRKMDRSKVQFDFMERVNERCVFDDEIEAMGGRIFRCASPDRHPLRSGRFYRKFFANHPEYCIVHEHRSTLSGFLGFMRAASDEHVPTIIVHAHSSSLSSWYGGLGNAVERITDKGNKRQISHIATDYFACSEAAKGWLFPPESGVADKVHLVPNGIDAVRFAFNEQDRDAVRRQFGIPEDAFVIGHVGRFSNEKNQTFLLDALASLHQNRSVYLLLLGAGSTKVEIEAKASKLGIGDRVVFAGLQDETWKFYSAMDVFCMPSLHEGLPVSAVEAQASGLPVLLSDGISQDADLGGDVEFKPLDDGPRSWGETLLAKHATPAERAKGVGTVTAAGYDVATVASELQKFYLERGCMK